MSVRNDLQAASIERGADLNYTEILPKSSLHLFDSHCPMPPAPEATVVITTRNRSHDLRRALTSAVAQEGNIEILVFDDASTDDTAKMVSEEFPTVQLVRRHARVGYIALRNEGIREAKAPIIFSIDDDAEFRSPTTIRDALRYFDHPRVGALSLPFINCVKGEMRPPMQPSPLDDRIWCVPHYMGTSHALVRDLFLKLGGYSESLLHWGEEEEYSRKLWGAGYIVRIANTPPIYHYPSPVGRTEWRRRLLLHRNPQLIEYWYTPALYLPHGVARSYGRFAKTLLQKRSIRGFAADVFMMANASLQALRGLADRRPLSVTAHRVYLRVRTAKTLPLGEIESAMATPLFSSLGDA